MHAAISSTSASDGGLRSALRSTPAAFSRHGFARDEVVLDRRAQDCLQQPAGLRHRHLPDALLAQGGVPGAHRCQRDPVQRRRAEGRVDVLAEERGVIAPCAAAARRVARPASAARTHPAECRRRPRRTRYHAQVHFDLGEVPLSLVLGRKGRRCLSRLALADRVAHLESPGGQPPHPPESAPLAAHDAKAGCAVSPATSPGHRGDVRRRAHRGNEGARGGHGWAKCDVGVRRPVAVHPAELGLRGERVTGIEPAWPAWKAGALPLSYTRIDHAGSDGDRRAWPSG
jgi:hypothetical protein